MKAWLFLFFVCVIVSGCHAGHELAVNNPPSAADNKSASRPRFLSLSLAHHHRTRSLHHVVETQAIASMSAASSPSAIVSENKQKEEKQVVAKAPEKEQGNNTISLTRKNDVTLDGSDEAATVPEERERSDELKPLNWEERDSLSLKYADKINVDPTDITNLALYQFIDTWWGVDYKWGGEDIDGIDCSAFSQKLYSEIYGVDILRTARQQHHECKRIKHVSDATEGDLVFFHVKSWRVSHVGVLLKNDYFVHASRSQGVTISSLHDKYWRKRYASCGRIAKERESAE